MRVVKLTRKIPTFVGIIKRYDYRRGRIVDARSMRRFFADTFAMVVFSVLVGVFVELAISGLALEQTMRVRAAAVPVSLAIGRPYGLYRDWLFHRLTDDGHNGLIRRIMVDTFANLTFQIPLYILILAFNGATRLQIIAAVGSILLIAVISGRPYGVFLNTCRRWFGVPTD